VGTGLSDRIVIVWHRGKAKINRLLRNTSGTPTVHEPTGHFPCDIKVIIIAYLTHDFRTLQACSLTCRGPAPLPYPQPGLRYARSLCGCCGKSYEIRGRLTRQRNEKNHQGRSEVEEIMGIISGSNVHACPRRFVRITFSP